MSKAKPNAATALVGGSADPPALAAEPIHAVLDRFSDAVYALDQDWRFTYVNLKAEELWGRRREALIGRVIWEEFPQAVSTEVYERHLRAARERHTQTFETASPVRDCWIEVSIYPDATGLSVYFRDITERKQTEEALRRSEHALQRAQMLGRLGHWAGKVGKGLGTERTAVEYSPTAASIFGVEPADLAVADAEYMRRFVHPADRDQLHASLLAFLAGDGESCAWEYRILRPDGAVRWVREIEEKVFDADGTLLHRLGALHDITELKETELALRERDERLQTALLASSTGTYRRDLRTNEIEEDGGLARLLGLPPGEWIRHADAFYDHVHPDDRGAVVAASRRCLEQGADFEMDYRVRRPDGSVRWLTDRSKLVYDEAGRPLYMTGACTDITARKQAEAHAARLAAIVESSEDAIMRQSFEGTITAWNAGAEKIYGYSAAEVLGRPTALIAPPDRVDEPRRLIARVRRGEVIRSFETVRRTKHGNDIHVSLSVSPIRDSRGRVVAVSTIARDVSERRRMEEELRRSEAEYRVLFEAAGIGAAETATDGRFLRVNRKFCEMTGYSREEMVGLPFADITHPDDLEESLAGNRSLQAGETDEFRTEKRYLRKDGSTLWVNLTANAIRDAAGRLVRSIVVVEDITARKQAEAQQALLTAELSHRVKNTLAVVQAIATQTVRQTPSPAAFADAFMGRLRALSAAHGLLTRSQWHAAPLSAVIGQALQAHTADEAAVTIGGPELMLSPKQTLTLSLVLHELATNAAKYGALSTPRGRIEVRWELDSEPRQMRLTWTERGGPPVAPLGTQGFGTRLIQESIAYELGGSATLSFEPEGLTCALTIPWKEPSRDAIG